MKKRKRQTSNPSSGPVGCHEATDKEKEITFAEEQAMDVSMMDVSRLSYPPLCAVHDPGGAADHGCDSLWEKSTENTTMETLNNLVDELHASKSVEHKNRFEAAATINDDFVAAMTNMEDCDANSHKQLKMNSDMSSKNDVPNQIQKSIRARKDGKKSW